MRDVGRSASSDVLSGTSSPVSAPGEVFGTHRFGELTTKKIKRGAHTSVKALEKDIRDWIKTWNDNPRPYVWVKTADQILAALARYCERVSTATAQRSDAR
jgi:hypothetical protein